MPVHTMLPRRLAAVNAAVLTSLELVLSSMTVERLAPIFWQYSEIKYSLTVPSEAVAAALVATVGPGYEDEVEMYFHLPEDGTSQKLATGITSSFVDVPTEEATKLVLEVKTEKGARATNYTIAVLRSTITSSYQFVIPDPAESVPPASTLTGLMVYNTFGAPARMNPFFFVPRRSQYIATLDFGIDWCWIVASKNDPDAAMELRVNGQDWTALESGIGSSLLPVSNHGWLLLEVRVSSPSAMSTGSAPLVYQVVVAHQVICHERCRSCFGPTESQCLRCRAPLVLFEGKCELTGCPPDAYYEWQSYQCRRCHGSCAQCRGPGSRACSLCPALAFLAPTAWEDAEGPCVMMCPVGTFAHPPSRRCRRPPSVVVKTFYVRLVFREPYERARQNSRLQESIINTTAFVLGLSLSDVRPFSASSNNKRFQITIEVVSPFLPKADVDRVSIDSWFGAYEVPMDVVTTHTWDELHPPMPAFPDEPLLPMWALGLIASGGVTVLVLIPLYLFYFRRLANTKKRYRARVGVDPVFLHEVVDESPAWIIRRFTAKAQGARNQLDRMD